MAVVSVSDAITTIQDFEGTATGLSNIGSGPGGTFEAGLHYENAQCAARRIGGTASDRGMWYTHASTTSLTSSSDTWIVKVYTALSAVITADGTKVRAGDTTSDYFIAQFGDDGTMGDNGEFGLPPKGGYVVLPWCVRASAWHTLATTGSPNITITDVWGFSHNVSATTGAGTSQALDAIHLCANGLGMTGGTGADPAGAFRDFLDYDEGTSTNRFGLWTSGLGGVINAFQTTFVGQTATSSTAVATRMTDSFFNVIFPGGFTDDNSQGMTINLGNASTEITWSDGTIAGAGRSTIKRYFDTELDVTGGGTDTIAITGHGFSTGDQVVYNAEGGAEDIGPDATTGQAQYATSTGVATNSSRWYVVKVDDDTIQLASTAYNALAATPTTQTLTPSTAGNGEEHSLRRKPEQRPNLTVNNSTGTMVVDRVVFNRYHNIVLNAACTFDGCTFIGGDNLSKGDAVLTNSVFNQSTVHVQTFFGSIAAVAVTHANDIDDMDGCTFIRANQVDGHAIYVQSNGTVAQDIGELNGITFTDYFTDDDNTGGGIEFNALNDVDGTNDEIDYTAHPFTTGDAVYYNRNGGTAIAGLTHDAKYYVRSVTVDSFSLHPTQTAATSNANKVGITAGTDQTHKFYSAAAAIINNTGTALTFNVIGGGTIPSVRNVNLSTCLVQQTVTLEVNGVTPGSICQMITTSGGPEPVDKLILDGVADSNGEVTASYNYQGDQPVVVRARNSGRVTQVWQDDGGAFTDYTAEAANRTDGGTPTTFPFLPAVPVASTDWTYIGGPVVFDEILWDTSTAAAGTFGLDWEYWNGSAWTDCVSVTEPDLTAVGLSTFSHTPQSNWTARAVNGSGTWYYIRVALRSGSFTTVPQHRRVTLSAPKFLPFTQNTTILTNGLTVTATWVEDTVALG